MPDDNHGLNTARAERLATLLTGVPWIEVLAQAWKFGRKIMRGLTDEGMYEVLEYETILELQDKRGENALLRKREKVRYLQNNIIAFQDQAWADGEMLINYHCTPGVPVDRYRPGRQTYILISLREVKNRGDVDEFNMQWGLQRGFARPTELWETAISHRTKRLKMQVVFPRTRPPRRACLIEGNRNKTHRLAPNAQVQFPDGRWCVSWETTRPRLNEHYLLKWDW